MNAVRQSNSRDPHYGHIRCTPAHRRLFSSNQTTRGECRWCLGHVTPDPHCQKRPFPECRPQQKERERQMHREQIDRHQLQCPTSKQYTPRTTWHDFSDDNRSSNSVNNCERGNNKGSVRVSLPWIPYHGQDSLWRNNRSFLYCATQLSMASRLRDLLIFTTILDLQLQMNSKIKNYIGHSNVQFATFTHPWEAHTTGLSESGFPNQVNTE